MCRDIGDDVSGHRIYPSTTSAPADEPPSDRNAPAASVGQDVAATVAEIQEHFVPGGLLIPAGVLEIVMLQKKGFGLVVNQ